MKKLSDIKRAEQILTEEDMVTYVQPTEKLPVPGPEELDKSYVLVGFDPGKIPSKTYKCVRTTDGYEWKLINYHEFGALDAPVGLWATSKLDVDTGRATVYIHWADPVDKPDAHWHHTVIVKKLGSAPTSMYDGEIVGYSSVKDQYAKKTGFIDSIDIDTVDSTTDGDGDNDDIIDDEEVPDIPKRDSNRYFYRVFAVSRYGVVTPSENSCNATLTWKEYQRLVKLGIGQYAVDVGDIVSIKWKYDGTNYVYIDFQVVAYNNATIDGPDEHANSVTFLAHNVLFRGSFDCQEDEYALTNDSSWNNNKRYYAHVPGSTENIYNPISLSDRGSVTDPRLWESNGAKAYEHNPCPTAAEHGRNTWSDSNIRAWLNSTDGVDWYVKPSGNVFDVYQSDPERYGAYGFGATKFVGFLGGLDPDLQAVLADVKVKTTIPLWLRSGSTTLSTTSDKIFLPSYIEVFGFGDDLNPIPEDIDIGEGQQFDIYKKKIVNTRIKTIFNDFNTTPDAPGVGEIASGELASWYTRTPVREIEQETKVNGRNPKELECVKVVSCKNIRYDVEHDLGEDIGSGRRPNEPIDDRSHYSELADYNDFARDKRYNVFRPVGTNLQFRNNSSPGFAPCFVIA